MAWVYPPAILGYICSMKNIPLTQGRFAIVDDADFDWLNQWKWQYSHKGYAVRSFYKNGKMEYVEMHRSLNKTPAGFQTDHRDGDRLNNQRFNLRTASASQNAMNRKPRADAKSKFKGVSWSKQKSRWVSRIFFDKKSIHLGFFEEEKEAAIAYNEAAVNKYGNFARLNII